LPIINPSYFVFVPELVLKLWIPQVWRLVTGFFITGPSLGLIMDPYFLFTYCKALEVDSSRFSQPGDLFVALVFICSVIMVRSVFFAPTPLSSFPLTHPHAYLPLPYLPAQPNT
jgi:Derlin-2/3